jgi:hypothetical protein
MRGSDHVIEAPIEVTRKAGETQQACTSTFGDAESMSLAR